MNSLACTSLQMESAWRLGWGLEGPRQLGDFSPNLLLQRTMCTPGLVITQAFTEHQLCAELRAPGKLALSPLELWAGLRHLPGSQRRLRGVTPANQGCSGRLVASPRPRAGDQRSPHCGETAPAPKPGPPCALCPWPRSCLHAVPACALTAFAGEPSHAVALKAQTDSRSPSLPNPGLAGHVGVRAAGANAIHPSLLSEPRLPG